MVLGFPVTGTAGPVHPEERSAATALLAYSFPDRDMATMVAGTPDDRIFVVRHQGEVVSAVLWRGDHVLWNGEAVAMAIAGPGATDPRFRGRGLFADRYRELLGAMRDAGCVLSGLETPITRWHQRNGWGVASAVTRHEAAPASFRPSMPRPEGVLVSAPELEDLQDVYIRAAAGRFGALARDRRAWASRVQTAPGMLRRDHVGWYDPVDGRTTGYAIYHHRTEPSGDRLAIVVDELMATSPTAWAGLLEFLAGHNNVSRLRWDAPQDFPLGHLIREPEATRPQHLVDKMVRVVDVPALRLHLPTPPPAGRRPLRIRIEDHQAPWNHGCWEVGQEADTVVRLTRSAAGMADCVIPAAVLGPLLTGYLSVAWAVSAGLVQFTGRSACTDLTTLFSTGSPPYCPDDW